MGCVCASVCKAMFISLLRKVNRNPPKYQKYIRIQMSLRNPIRILVKKYSIILFDNDSALHFQSTQCYWVFVVVIYLCFCSCDLFVQKLFPNFTSVFFKTPVYFVCFHCLPVNELSLAHSKYYINI